MPVPIKKMILNMHALRDQIEDVVVGQASVDLARIFDDGAKKLAFQEETFKGLLTHPSGKIQNVPANLEKAEDIFRATLSEVDDFLIGPGELWADDIIPKMQRAGRNLARANLNVAFVSPERVKSAFSLVSQAEKAVLVTGYSDTYKIMNVVGDDVAAWFRDTMVDSVIEELPIVNKLDPNADTLMKRLVESGRIKPMKIKTQSGKIITRSVRQRAEAIARVESAKIINRTHEALVHDVLGDEAVYRNSNPRDSRTTPVCRHASQIAPMTLAEWSDSRFGRPPRLNPFHLCRSVLIGGMDEWFEGLPEGKTGPLPKITKKKAPRKRPATLDREARAAAKAAAAEELLKAGTQAFHKARASTNYSAGLAEILTGKLTSKKMKTVQKRTKEAGLNAGIPTKDVDAAIADTLRAMEAAFTDEEKAFAAAYNALVKTKEVPLGTAAEILAKAKAGKLRGKSAAKARQALAEIEAGPQRADVSKAFAQQLEDYDDGGRVAQIQAIGARGRAMKAEMKSVSADVEELHKTNADAGARLSRMNEVLRDLRLGPETRARRDKRAFTGGTLTKTELIDMERTRTLRQSLGPDEDAAIIKAEKIISDLEPIIARKKAQLAELRPRQQRLSDDILRFETEAGVEARIIVRGDNKKKDKILGAGVEEAAKGDVAGDLVGEARKRETMESGQAWVDDVISDEAFEDVRFDWKNISAKDDPDGRAFYRQADDSVNVGPAVTRKTIVHELGHKLEQHQRAVQARALEKASPPLTLEAFRLKRWLDEGNEGLPPGVGQGATMEDLKRYTADVKEFAAYKLALPDPPAYAGLQYRDHRRALSGQMDQSPQELKKVLPEYGYEADEKGWDDEFYKTYKDIYPDKAIKNNVFYTGKFYAHGSDEIVSMGMETLYKNAPQFAQNDPEYVKFILAFLDGYWMPAK